jgi:hypothetical protein
LRSTRGHFRPDPEAHSYISAYDSKREFENSKTGQRQTQQQKCKKFKRRMRRSCRLEGYIKGRSSSSSEKAVRVGSEPIRLDGPGRRVGPVGLRGTLRCNVSAN